MRACTALDVFPRARAYKSDHRGRIESIAEVYGTTPTSRSPKEPGKKTTSGEFLKKIIPIGTSPKVVVVREIDNAKI